MYLCMYDTQAGNKEEGDIAIKQFFRHQVTFTLLLLSQSNDLSADKENENYNNNKKKKCLVYLHGVCILRA